MKTMYLKNITPSTEKTVLGRLQVIRVLTIARKTLL